jgi:hypothetical protein
MSDKIKVIDDSYSSKKTWSLFSTTAYGLEFNVFTKNGIVIGWQYRKQEFPEEPAQLMFRFICNGKLYSRRIEGQYFTRLGISRKAAQFAREVVENENR